MLINFKNLKHENKSIEFDETVTVSEAKIKVGEAYEVEPNLLKLIYAGAVLKDDQKLASLNIPQTGFIVAMSSKPKTVQPTTTTSTSTVPSVTIPTPTVVPSVTTTTTPASAPAPTSTDQPSEMPPNVSRYFIRWITHPAVSVILQINPVILIQLLRQDSVLAPYFSENLDNFRSMLDNIEQYIDPNTLNNNNEIDEDDDEIGQLPIPPSLPQGASQVQLTQEEKADLDSLIQFATEMGVNSSIAIQYFMACEKNKELAMDLIMQERFQ